MILLKKILPLFISTRSYQVTVLGGATDIGKTLALLLRMDPRVTKLLIHDTQSHAMEVALDLSHVPSKSTIEGYIGEDALTKSLVNSRLILVAGGLMRKPNISQNVWLNSNMNFMRCIARSIARITPMPFVGIVTEPINVLVPMTAEVMRNYDSFDPKKLFGITTIDAMQAQSLYAADYKLDPEQVTIPVICGHSDKTCIPLLSQAKPSTTMDKNGELAFTLKFRKANENITKAKNGLSPVVSVAYSALLFTRSVLDVLNGKKSTVNAFVANNDFGTEYFSGIVHIDHDGIIEMQRYSNLSDFECNLLESSIELLREDVLRGKKILNYS